MKVKDSIADAVNRALDRKPAAAPSVNPATVLETVIPQVPKVRLPEFSVIICSINDEKFKNVCEAYKVALSGEAYEVIRIADATGLAEGYNRGVKQSVGRIVIFSHDDAAPMRPIAAKLRRHLRQVDIVGGAGSNRLDGPAWFTAGPAHTAGQVLNQMGVKNADGSISVQFLLSVYGVPDRLVTDIQVIDGFWMACNRSILRTKGDDGWMPPLGPYATFDEETCPGFHGYDIDFSFGAYLRGVRIGVACDLCLLHASTGGYGDAKWKPAADKLSDKYAAHWSQHQPFTWQFSSVVGTDMPAMLTTMEHIVERTTHA